MADRLQRLQDDSDVRSVNVFRVKFELDIGWTPAFREQTTTTDRNRFRSPGPRLRRARSDTSNVSPKRSKTFDQAVAPFRHLRS
jgi:hypothetical protein